jgi:hypothetical protein
MAKKFKIKIKILCTVPVLRKNFHIFLFSSLYHSTKYSLRSSVRQLYAAAQRKTALKYGVNRRQIQKWLAQESSLRTGQQESSLRDSTGSRDLEEEEEEMEEEEMVGTVPEPVELYHHHPSYRHKVRVFRGFLQNKRRHSGAAFP